MWSIGYNQKHFNFYLEMEKIMLILLPLLNIFTASLNSETEPYYLWTTDSLNKVFTDSPIGESVNIKIACAKNEYQSGQFAITANKDLENVSVEIGEIVHFSGYTLPPENIDWNFVGYVSLAKNTYHTPNKRLIREAPADFPDPLLDKRIIRIESGITQPVWLTVNIPKDAPDGNYIGKVDVITSQGKKSLDISMEVYPFILPDERHLLVTLWFSPQSIAQAHEVEIWSYEYWEILGRYAKNMAEHGQNVVETDFPGPIIRRSDGSLEIDYTRMDRWIQFFDKFGACERIEFPAVAHTIVEEGKGHWDSKELAINNITVLDEESGKTIKLEPEEGMALMLENLDMHLQEKGWQDRAMVHVSDEPTIYKLESYCNISGFIKQHAPHLKIIEAIETTGFGDCLDVWVPKLSHLMNWYDEYMEEIQDDKELWFYTCCHPYGIFPNRFIDFELIETRILFWLNWKYRLDGYLHWGLNRWTQNPFKDIGDNLPPGDRYIIYPGQGSPLDSIRWEATREGLQDYKYFRLLAEKTRNVKEKLGNSAKLINPRRRSDEICRSVVYSFTEFERKPEKLRQARNTIAREIEELDQRPLILVQTTPQAETKVYPGPILVLVRGVAEKGTAVKIQGISVEVKPDGTFAGHAFVSPGREDVIIEAELEGSKKQILRHFQVIE
ncbi:DUF4091 domain-containing protein [Candidatus Poribacteria bacterium]|nr:DUF4091 domain-containing protein [Candidatus Poribacteria bacterium]